MNWLKRWIGQSSETVFAVAGDSIHQIAMNNAINRRRNTRILYPHVGPIGGLPKIFYQGNSIRAADISLGGICLIDDENRIGEAAGIEVELSLQWPDFTFQQVGVVVGVNLDRRHIQFEKPHPEIYVRLNLLLKPGFVGARFRKVAIGSSQIPVEAEELWLGPTGESLTFFTERPDSDLFADAVLDRVPMRIFRSSVPTYRDRGPGRKPGQRIAENHLMDLIVCLANIKGPSHRVLDLIDLLPEWLAPHNGEVSR